MSQKQSNKNEIWIFYSEITEPDILNFYSESLVYLKESSVDVHIVNINKDSETARKFNVIATPLFVVKKGGVVYRHMGIVNGMKKLIMDDLKGKSVLHVMGFKEGRIIGNKIKSNNKEEIEIELKKILSRRNIEEFKILEFDDKNQNIKIELKVSQPKDQQMSEKPSCFEIASLLGGIFTSIHNIGIHFKEIDHEAPLCKFETIKIKENDVND